VWYVQSSHTPRGRGTNFQHRTRVFRHPVQKDQDVASIKKTPFQKPVRASEEASRASEEPCVSVAEQPSRASEEQSRAPEEPCVSVATHFPCATLFSCYLQPKSFMATDGPACREMMVEASPTGDIYTLRPILADMDGAGAGSGTKRSQPDDADEPASPFRDYTGTCRKRKGHSFLGRSLFVADEETTSAQRAAVGGPCTASDAVAGQLSPRLQDLTPSRPPSVVPSLLFPGGQCKTPGPPDELRAMGRPHQRPSQQPTHGAPSVGPASRLPGAGSKAITPPYDPICLGFFAKKWTPSPERPLAKPVFPKCLSPVLPARPSMATLKQDYVRQEKQELMELFMEAQANGNVILTGTATTVVDKATHEKRKFPESSI
jgi:hypothetical protein